MTHPLTLTLKIKQDPETLAALNDLKENFAEHIQPKIEEALRKSKLVHFARVVVIGDNEYIQVITEYDGDHFEYTEFFRDALTPIFAKIFSLADGVPDVDNPAEFFEFSKNANVRTLGLSTDGATDMHGNQAGWLFSAYNHAEVRDILGALQRDAAE
ncbi:hypothetical protein [Roseibium aggregatum]|uniref:Uncharacterized protein n=1 Tax=Roseibium aggregatum TaxID=187304 RepID=A0A939EF61_9HYPH|nr:hypothetical protein [Roseibium aggregatum]MBN9671853.1 hypothetical protein [Roseibium aggregatum]